MMLIHNIKYFFLIFCYQNQKEQAIDFHQKYFHSYDTLYFIITKGTRNKFAPEIFSFL